MAWWDSLVRVGGGNIGDRSIKGKLEPGRGLECQARGFVLSALGSGGWWMPSCKLTCWLAVVSEVTHSWV